MQGEGRSLYFPPTQVVGRFLSGKEKKKHPFREREGEKRGNTKREIAQKKMNRTRKI